MIVAIHQPNYLPYLGFFHKLALSDLFVLYDDAEFVKEMYYHRNQVKSLAGPVWLTVPVQYKFRDHPAINQMLIANSQPWRNKHWRTIVQLYSKAPYFPEYRHIFEEIYRSDWSHLVDLNIAIIETLVTLFKIPTRIIRSSSIQATGSPSQRLVEICIKCNASTYLSGPTGRRYLDEQLFTLNGIELWYHRFNHPYYNQLHGPFVKNMSVIDFLFNEGAEAFYQNWQRWCYDK